MAKLTGPEDTTKEIPLLSDSWADDIDNCIFDFCSENPDCDITRNQNHWSCCLMDIYDHVFKPSRNMNNNCKSVIDPLDVDTLNAVLDKYLRLCSKYGREVSILGFSHLTGISTDTIHSFKDSNYRGTTEKYFNNNKYNNYSAEELRQKRLDIFKKITENHESSIRAKLFDSNNVTGQAILVNHDFMYNAPGMKPEDGAKGNMRLTRSELLRGISKQDMGEDVGNYLPKV